MNSILTKPISLIPSSSKGSWIGLMAGVLLLALGSSFIPSPFLNLFIGLPLIIFGFSSAVRCARIITGIGQPPLGKVAQSFSFVGLLIGLVGAAGVAVRASIVVVTMQRNMSQYHYEPATPLPSGGEWVGVFAGPLSLGFIGFIVFVISMSWPVHLEVKKQILILFILSLILPLIIWLVLLLGKMGIPFSA